MRSKILSTFVAVISITVLSPAAHAAPQDSDQVAVARWDVILNDNATESVEAVDSKIIQTPSTVYHAEVFNADALRAGINAAAAAGGLEAGSQSMAHSQSFGMGTYYMQPLYFNYYMSANSRVSMNGNANGNETIDNADATHVHLKINYTGFGAQLFEMTNGRRTSAPMDKKASIVYDGQLNAGDAVAFSATIKGKSGTSYRHMVVWEAFKSAQRYQQCFQMMQDSERWCQLGPSTIRRDADIATVWAAGAAHPTSTVAAKWEQKLEDGKTIRLIGISRSDKYLFCWWDGDGLPVLNQNFINFQKYYNDKPVWFSAEVSGSADEWKKQTPTGHPSRNNGPQSGPYTTSISTVTDNGQAVIGVPVGDWEKIGEIKKAGTIKVGAVTYRLSNIQSMGDNGIFAQFYPDRGNASGGDLVTLSVVTQDGKEVDTDYLPMITARNYGMSSPQFQEVKLADVKTYEVWRRKQQWVTFTGFATEPTTPPKDQVTDADLKAASAMQEQKQLELRVQQALQQTAALKEKRKSWEAIPADATTPKGALRVMFAAAGKGDLASVRAMLKSSQPDSTPLLDATARVITATATARATAVARFGEENVLSLQGENVQGMPPLADLEMQMMEETWTPRPDGGLQGGDVALTKGDDGKFYLDLGLSRDNQGDADLKGMLPMFVAMAVRAEQIDKSLKDNPKMTLEEFRQMVGTATPVVTQ